MRKKNILILIFFILMFVHLYSIDAPIDLVNPLIGTGGHGHTFPGATLPFGMVQLSPDTDTEGWDWCSGYHYSDSSIMGFSHTHLSGTGASDYGDILVMPTTGRVKLKPGSKDNPEKGYRSRFSHKKESATPGFYSVYLEDYDIDVELTVTKRAGFHKYNFPNTDRANIIFDLQHGIHDRTKEAYVKLVNDQEIEGYRRSTGWAKDHCVYFIAKFSQKFEQYGIEENEKLRTNKKSAKGRNIKTFFRFTTRKNSPVLVKVGISHTSIEGARKNLDTEIPAWNFEKIRKNAKNNWTKALNKIDVKGGIGESREVFYTAFYHTMIAPNTFMDVDSQYIRMDDKIHKAEGFTNYTVFSLWDTFRALHPLLNILKPNKSRDMIKTMLKKYEHSGLLPVWELAANETNCMIGYHSIPVITDAYIKGIKDFDIDRAYKAMKTSAMQNDFGIKPYREYGYIPANLEHESVSKTLEYAYDDWCIAQMAKKMGKQEDYQYFIKRAQYYKNLFDNQTGFMRPKKRGKWSEPFNPNAVSGDYTEANAWQYSFFAPQDVSGMLELYGGKKKFCKKLDDLFSTSKQLTGKKQPDISGLIGQYAHGNEPSHHMAYLYSYADQEWKTQAMLRRIMTNFYTNEPEGLAGNEDCGQMSAWYIFSSMGFYPVCPGSDYYVLGTPLFKEAEIHLKNGRSINITA
ncbi:MAG: GH92 family glycosyl hydrolase, partial [Candidatus Marinimicrobia bacterium]|nr:GH92 family glycosyl hydrolase [Candidatus Neomarinimicrobiota bacterium]